MVSDSVTAANEPYHKATIDGEAPQWRVARSAPMLEPPCTYGAHLVATLYFDSLDAVKAGLASPQGQAAAGILPTLPTVAQNFTFRNERSLRRRSGHARRWRLLPRESFSERRDR
jgi:hypothetical protein